MSELLYGLKMENNKTLTANGAVTYKSTLNKVYDLFALGGAMRHASDSECIELFENAYLEDKNLALKCLFYLRDCNSGEGQGERRFFRLAMNWLGLNYPNDVKNLIYQVSEFGRWDDLYCFIDTPLEKDIFAVFGKQLLHDLDVENPSLLAKWLKSENTSSSESCKLGTKTRIGLGLTAAKYRKMLSTLRARINIVETLMSQNRWNEIEFDKLPSRAGLKYKEAFAKHDLNRYADFITDEKTSVNAKTLYPYDVVHQVINDFPINYNIKQTEILENVKRSALNKYWDNLTDYFNNATLNALTVIDTSGSMTWGSGIHPIDVAISLGLYCAERANGPFKNHFISFSSRPQLIETTGVDFVDKVRRIYRQNLCENTNIEATFELILKTAIKQNLTQKQLPENIIIISDMQFDDARNDYYYDNNYNDDKTLMENIETRWNRYGYKMPKLIYWNVNAGLGRGNIPMKDKDGITFVSGASPVIFDMVMSGKTGMDIMLDKLNSERYSVIHI